MAANSTEPESMLVAAIVAGDVGAVRSALARGSNPHRDRDGRTPLHVAARLGPLPVVEALIEAGSFDWQRDDEGHTALEIARLGVSPDRDAIVEFLDRESDYDPSFRAAVAAIHLGDVAALERSIDAEPRLLTDRIVGPDAYRKRARAEYFRDPKLFWFVANNPTTVARMAPNVVDIARAMIARGVDRVDLDYTLQLVMSGSAAREQGHQVPLMRALLAAGAVAERRAIVVAAAHGERDALRELLARGTPVDLPIAATLGDSDAVRRHVPAASRETVTLAFGLAVINRQHGSIRATLEAGADFDAFLPVHSHSTPLHQAAANDDVETIELLLRAGARSDTIDTLWEATPLAWARYANNDAAVVALTG